MTFTHTPAPARPRWFTPLCAALLVGVAACAGRQPTGVLPTPPAPATNAFLDTVEQRTFNYFWATTNPANGLVPDRYPTPSFSSIAATGFGLTAYPIGVERGWVTRSQASSSVLPDGGALHDRYRAAARGRTLLPAVLRWTRCG